MFSSELDRAHFPLSRRSRGIALGMMLLVTVAAALVSPRTLPFLFLLSFACFVGAAALAGNIRSAIPRYGSVFWHLAIFLLYAATPAFWSMDAGGVLLATLFAAVAVCAAYTMVQAFDDESRANLLHMGEGLWIGFAVALAYLLIEIFTDQSIKIWAYNWIGVTKDRAPPLTSWEDGKLVYMAREVLTRNMAPLTLFLWPAVMAIAGTVSRRKGVLLAAVTFVAAVVTVILGTNDTAKIALAGGVLAFACALVMARTTARILAGSWVFACLAVLPLALLAHRNDLHNARWLPDTARHRIIIWNYTAEQVLQSPWVGVGGHTTYILGPELEKIPQTQPDEHFPRTLSKHSHSVFLQTWFELGLFGATLLTLVGLSLLQAIDQLSARLRPFGYATFATGALMAASSYGMWQTWFFSMFCLTAALFGLGAKALATRPAPD
jgi:hypothetical protein